MRNTSRLLDIIDRAHSGPACEEKDFDLKHVAAGVSRVIKEYDIRFDKARIIQTDDDMIDRVWQAALDFLAACGVYCTSTRRRMVFSRREMEEAIRAAPSEVTIGDGRDVRVLRARTVEDRLPPQVSGGPIGTNLSPENYVAIMQSYAQEPIIDLVVPGTIVRTHGREVRSKSPLEILASWEEVEMVFSALRRAGRPGLASMGVEMAMSEIGHLSAISRGGYRPTDVQIAALIGELKTNYELLNKVAHTIMTDGILLGFYNPILGGLAGPEEGLAVLITAGMIALQLVYMPASVCTCPTHPFLFCDTAPAILRALSVYAAAVARNSQLLTEVMTSPVGGPCTETVLFESTAMATIASVCGVSRALGVRSAVGVVEDHCTGLEARFNGEVAHAAAGLPREQADEIVRKAVAKYEPLLPTRPVGLPFAQAYDPVTVRPARQWLEIYDRVREEVAGWGLPLQ